MLTQSHQRPPPHGSKCNSRPGFFTSTELTAKPDAMPQTCCMAVPSTWQGLAAAGGLQVCSC